MKKKTKIILIVLAIALIAAGLLGSYILTEYILHDDYKDILSTGTFEEAVEFTALNDTDVSVPGMVLVAENDKYKLYTDTTTTEVALYNKDNGQAYYSNPVGRNKNATDYAGQELNAQFKIEYYTSARQLGTMDNYTMSVAKQQFELESIEDGIRYTYTLGNLESKTGIVPTVITKERLELFLANLSEEDAKTISRKYTESKEEEGVMELLESAQKPLMIKRMAGAFEKAGYTQEDYDLDMANAAQEEPVSFTIPLDYKLTEEGLSVSVETSAITEKGEAKLYTIQLLKYFGAADSQEEGYIFVPNGSGSLIHFNNGKTDTSYTQYMYELDPTVASYTVVENTQAARLPVFGMKYDTGALFAVIAEGDALSRIDAATAGGLVNYNNVYATFYLRGYELLSMFGVSGTQSDLPVVEDNFYETTLRVDYVPLDGENADYSGMAEYYRNRLISEGVLGDRLTNTELPFYLDILGGVNVKKDIAGIQYMDVFKMTTYKDALSIAGLLKDDGIHNIRMNYLGWFNGGYYHDVPDKITEANLLGSKADISALNEFLNADGGGLFGNVAFNKVSYTSARYLMSQETAKYFTGKIVVSGDVNPVSLMKGNNVEYVETIYSILSPRFLDKYTEKFAKAISKYDMSGIALRDLGNFLASDKKRSQLIDRQESLEIHQKAFETLEGTEKDLMVYSANAYSLAYASDIVDAPLDGSQFFITDETVPFYEMVIHGYINYSGSALNLTQSTERNELLLDLIENGAAPRYTMSWENSDNIKYSGLNSMYSVQYEIWAEEAAEFYAQLSEALKDVVNVPMVKHEIITEDIRKITYENGHVIYVNRGNEDAEIDGITIPGKWYSKGGIE